MITCQCQHQCVKLLIFLHFLHQMTMLNIVASQPGGRCYQMIPASPVTREAEHFLMSYYQVVFLKDLFLFMCICMCLCELSCTMFTQVLENTQRCWIP